MGAMSTQTAKVSHIQGEVSQGDVSQAPSPRAHESPSSPSPPAPRDRSWVMGIQRFVRHLDRVFTCLPGASLGMSPVAQL